MAAGGCGNTTDDGASSASDSVGAAGTSEQGMQPATMAGGSNSMQSAGSSLTTAMTGEAGDSAGMGSEMPVAGSSGQQAGAAAGTGGAAGNDMQAAAGGSEAGAAGSGAATMQAMPPFMPTGEPITAPDQQWMWVPFPDSECRDGSPAGISVNLSSGSNKLMLYLEGGGACFDAGTCGSNPANIPTSAQKPGAAGLWDRANSENPVRDWDFVYVPYCTGDVHMGDAQDVTIPGVDGKQQFVGRHNLELFLNRIVPTFSDAEQVLLTGISAGGFGASADAEFVQWAFGSIPVTMIDDSGPTMSNKYLPSCLTDLYRKYWGLDKTILKLCGSDCDPDGDYSVDYAKHTAKLADGRFAGLIESNQDAIIRGFFGIGTNNGANDCMGTLLVTSMDAKQFDDGLLDFRMLMQDVYPTFGTYYPASTQHTWLSGDSVYTNTTDGVRMIDWIKDILAGTKAGHVGH